MIHLIKDPSPWFAISGRTANVQHYWPAIARSITWCVWLGANTAKRLAAEWRVNYATASRWLRRAAREGLLRATRRTRNCPYVYRIARMEAGMVDRSTK